MEEIQVWLLLPQATLRQQKQGLQKNLKMISDYVEQSPPHQAASCHEAEMDTW